MKVKEEYCNEFEPQTLHTKFGNANFDGNYYRISSHKEDNFGKRLHRLIYEDFYGIKLPQEIEIHHIDGNKLNNCILNLEAMPKGEHSRIHKIGENNPMFNKDFTKEHRQKLSESHKNKVFSKETCEKIGKHRSIASNTTGYYRVSKYKCKTCKQGFTYVYEYINENKQRKTLSSIHIDKLKDKVLSKGLEWIEYGGESNDTITI